MDRTHRLSLNRSSSATAYASRQRTFEPLEERRLLVASTYVNDNWTNLTAPGQPVQVGHQVRSNLDSGAVITAEYGHNAFGIVEGTSLAQFATIPSQHWHNQWHTCSSNAET